MTIDIGTLTYDAMRVGGTAQIWKNRHMRDRTIQIATLEIGTCRSWASRLFMAKDYTLYYEQVYGPHVER